MKDIHYLKRTLGLSYPVIAKQLTHKTMTVYTALRRYEARDLLHVDHRILNGQDNKRRKITAKLEEFLLSDKVLQKWSGLFISQRCMLLDLDHNVKIAESTLRQFYVKHHVKNLTVSYNYAQAMNRGP